MVPVRWPTRRERTRCKASRSICPDMCEQCKEIDAKIEHYQRFADRITDQTTIAGLTYYVAVLWPDC